MEAAGARAAGNDEKRRSGDFSGDADKVAIERDFKSFDSIVFIEGTLILLENRSARRALSPNDHSKSQRYATGHTTDRGTDGFESP